MGRLGLFPFVFLLIEVLILLYHLRLVQIVLQVCQNLAQIVPQIPFSEGLLVQGLLYFQQNYYKFSPVQIGGRAPRSANARPSGPHHKCLGGRRAFENVKVFL
jgi:hypothetical protein